MKAPVTYVELADQIFYKPEIIYFCHECERKFLPIHENNM